MGEPSDYELAAWKKIQQFKDRPLSRILKHTSGQVLAGAEKFGERAHQYLGDHPGTQSAVARGQEVARKGALAVGSQARRVADGLPDAVTDWSSASLNSARRTVGRSSRIGLSPQRVLRRHQKRGHAVTSFADLRRLDLEEIDAVRGRGASWYYPALAAASGAGAGMVITGGTLAVPVSGGVAAAPAAGAVMGSMVGDATVVLGLASRSVGQVALCYGYDPEDPAEKLFVMAVVNAGTAMSASAKTAAMMDISRLTQALVRGSTWAVLDKSLVSQASKQFAKAFHTRFTKQSLGKVAPAAGIIIGGTFNWATLEGIVDAADVAYRRRFLLEKYPHLGDEETPVYFPEGDADTPADDKAISVLGEIAEAGGPDLR